MPYPLLTKTRFNQFKEELYKDPQLAKDAVDAVINIMLRVFEFNPNKVVYTPETIKSITACRKKKQEETGQSSYQIFHANYYQENKERLNAQRTENRRKAKARQQAIEQISI